MKQLQHDFLFAEGKSILKTLLPLAVLWWALHALGPLEKRWQWVIPLAVLLVSLRLLWYTFIRLPSALDALPPGAAERLAREYAAPHPCLPIYQGEVHLLPSGLAARSRRRFLLFPAGSIRAAEATPPSARNYFITTVRLLRENGRSAALEFPPKKGDGVPLLLAYLHRQGIPVSGSIS